MATLVWDEVGERVYQTGLDRGVLYLHDGTVAPWNGLIDIEESPKSDLKSFYLDGVKYLDNLSPGDFIGKLKAYTYPEEFDSVNGIRNLVPGLSYHNQPSESFNLSYRTKIGNDLDGLDYGYRIHILYNITASPDAYSFGSLSESSVQPIEFAWSLTGVPVKFPGGKFRPTVHISVDSINTPYYILQILEDKLYGSDKNEPSLPSIKDVAELLGYLGALIIVDYGDGSWLAIDESDTYIDKVNDTTYTIDHANIVVIDPDTYTISSTNVS